MKFCQTLTVFTVIIILFSCSQRLDTEQELEHKAIIDAEANELLQTEQLEIVETLLNLDDNLYELDLVLNGEAGKFTESFDETNHKLTDLNEKLRKLRENLYSQADALEDIRIQSIEPIVNDAMEKYEAKKESDTD
jgi:uncharacterized protein YukE